MKKYMKLWALVVGLATGLSLLSTSGQAAGAPDMATLQYSGLIIKSRVAGYQPDPMWEPMTRWMRNVTDFDPLVAQIESIVCGTGTNKSVLLVGEPTETYQYLFARLAERASAGCQNFSHVEINVGLVESGNKYVGDVDKYWNDKIQAPSNTRDVIMYLRNLNSLIGVGSHMNDETGIESTYVQNFTSGKMITVAFMNKYEYEYYSHNQHAYVVNAFARTIRIDEFTGFNIANLVNSYFKTFAPALTASAEVLMFMGKQAQYYLPNILEPQRSISVARHLAKPYVGTPNKPEVLSVNPAIETPHPYAANSQLTFKYVTPENAIRVGFRFASFETESSTRDYLKIVNSKGETVGTFGGNLGAFDTPMYPADTYQLIFISDTSVEKAGFVMNAALVELPPPPVDLTRTMARRAVMEVAQVPNWIIDRKFEVVKNLRAKLDGDVVGCLEAKADSVRLATQGYVGGKTDEKPIATILYTGPTGTGKSYMAKKMAEYLGIKLITIDMTSYKTPESFDRFLDVMSSNLTIYPYAIYLFEEIDKADAKILDRLYFMMDEGVFYDKRQRPLFARGAYIIMTTNAAEDAILQNPNHPDLKKLVYDELFKMFRPSFINRFDAISIFLPFTQAEYLQLAKIMTSKKAKALKEMFDWNTELAPAVVEFIAKYGQSPRFGARPMERLVENTLATGIAEYELYVGSIDEKANLKFDKDVNPKAMKLTVNNGKTHKYEVDTDVNGGRSRALDHLAHRNSKVKRILDLFDQIRMY